MSAFAGRTALIIEDDSSSIKVLEQLLKQAQVQSFVLRDSSVMESEIQSLTPPDVIFLDLEMPHINGYRVFEFIQSNPDLANVPVVAYTTHISHLNDVKKAGFNGFLGKPLDHRAFPTLLAKILNGESVWEVPS